MLDALISFEWSRDAKGYRLVPARPHSRETDRIVPNGGDVITYRPFARGGDVCSAFAEVRTADQLLRFVKDHGALTFCHHGRDSPLAALGEPDEPVSVGLAVAKAFRELIEAQALGDPKRLASVFKSIRFGNTGALTFFEQQLAGFQDIGLAGYIELLPDAKKGVRLTFMPTTLLKALWLQFALKLSALRICPVCQGVFEVGRGTLRADAKFCSRKHKEKFFNDQRSHRNRR